MTTSCVCVHLLQEGKSRRQQRRRQRAASLKAQGSDNNDGLHDDAGQDKNTSGGDSSEDHCWIVRPFKGVAKDQALLQQCVFPLLVCVAFVDHC